ncbi:MAG: hypothetical protein CL940_01180 [Deltaproteobacteria bacterium]|nr:hypothetical protein [Deltaproteobacteria bacterium]
MRFGYILVLACLLTGALGCGGPQASLVYSFEELECMSCLSSVAHELSERPGVEQAKTDKNAVSVRVTYDASVATPRGLDEVVQAKGFPWSRERAQGSWAPEIPFPESLDVQKISLAGEEVELAAHLAPGKVTVFDFFAAWCGPCRVVTHEIKQIMLARDDVALRKVNIVDWDRPVVRQHLQGVTNIPHVLVYGPDGTRVAAITGVKKDALRAAIEQAGGSAPAPSSEESEP